MYVAKVAAYGFSPYTYLYWLAAYRSWPRDSMPGLGPSRNEGEIILVDMNACIYFSTSPLSTPSFSFYHTSLSFLILSRIFFNLSPMASFAPLFSIS